MKRNWIGAVIIMLAVMGCGNEDSNNQGADCMKNYAPTTVKWWIDQNDGSLNWRHVCDSSEFISGTDHNFDLIWCCADYQGQQDVYVDLSFWSWDNGPWQLENEYVAEGICDENCY